MLGKELYRRIFELYVDQEIDFIDAYDAAPMEKQGLSQIYLATIPTSIGLQVLAVSNRKELAWRLIRNRQEVVARWMIKAGIS